MPIFSQLVTFRYTNSGLNNDYWNTLLELKWLKDFAALAEMGSFSKAAQARAVTQPAFSRRIRSLENWLGVALVDRDHYPTRLTPAGDAFLEQSQQLMAQIYASRQRVREIGRTDQPLTILAQHALAVAFFPELMSRIKTLNDQFFLRVEAGDLHDSVDAFMAGNGGLLLAYAYGDIFTQLKSSNVQSLQVGSDQLILVSAVDAEGKVIHEPLPGQPMQLLMHPPESFFGRLVERHCLPRLPSETIVHKVCENALSEALKAMALQCFGAAWLPKSLIERELDAGLLKPLTGAEYAVDLPIKIYRLNMVQNELLEQLWVCIKECNRP